MRLLFFGTSSWVVPILKKIADEHEIAAVFTTPDAPVGRKHILTASPVGHAAEQLHLPTYKPENLRDEASLSCIQAIRPDAFIVASYGKIIPKNILDLYPNKFFNLHPSLLPRYRGPTPMQTALLDGATESGMSIIIMDELVDHGPLVAQEKITIDKHDTLIHLEHKFSENGSRLLLQILAELENNKLHIVDQNHTQATFTKMISKADGKVDWNTTAQEIYNHYRAYIVWPGIWTTKNQDIIKILECSPRAENRPTAPGTLNADGSVSCGKNTSLQIHTLQEAGGRPISVDDFIRGRKDWIGTAFGT